MKYILKIFILSFLYTLLSSHEFWIEPDKFFYKRGETINLRFRVGENFDGENWSGNRTKVQKMNFYFGGVKDSCNQNLTEEEGDSLQIMLLDEGTAMITMTTTNSFIELEADKFNDYLREDGLAETLQYRMQHGDSAKAGREYYQRSIKTIIQVGANRDKTYKQITNLPIDIIPDDHPYHVAKDDNFKVRLLFKNTPMAHQNVKVWHRQNNRTTVQLHLTDEKGEFKFFLTPSGKWMITTVKMERLENDPKAEWQSYWGSLTFGYE